MKRTSAGLKRVLIGTIVPPVRATAAIATTSSAPLGRYSATRSPWRWPSPISALASRWAAPSRSAKVIRSPPQMTASRAG